MFPVEAGVQKRLQHGIFKSLLKVVYLLNINKVYQHRTRDYARTNSFNIRLGLWPSVWL